MAVRIGYSLQTVTQILNHVQTLNIKNSGWVRLSTTESDPVFLDALTEIGNFSASFWRQGPQGLSSAVPINIVVAEKNDRIYQTIFYLSKVFERSYSPDVKVWSGWVQLQSLADSEFGSSAPANPSHNMIWFNTQSGNPILQCFNAATREWIEVQPDQLMKLSVYDPQNKCTDVYAFCQTKISENDLATIVADYTTHIADEALHITSEERVKWNSAQKVADTDAVVSNLKAEMQEFTDVKVAERQTTNELQLSGIESAEQTLAQHKANAKIHPTQTKQSEWVNKMDDPHMHYLDGHVTVESSCLVDAGYGPLSPERFNKAAMERGISVETEAERLALTIEDIQDGDSVYVKATKSSYFVIDQTKLGTEQAFLRFSVHQKDLTWNNLKQSTIPTTVDGYGITDAYDTAEYNNVYNSNITGASSLKGASQTFRNAVVNTGVTQTQINTIGSYQPSIDEIKENLATLWDQIIA